MPWYVGSGSSQHVADIYGGVRAKLNFVGVDAVVPTGTTLSVIVRNGDTGELIGSNSTLATGSNVISCSGKEMKRVKLNFSLTGPITTTPSYSCYLNVDEIAGGGVIALPGDVNVLHTVQQMDYFSVFSGAMVYFPPGCRSKVSIRLVIPKSTRMVPGSDIILSNAIKGDDGIRFIKIDPMHLDKGQSIGVLVSNSDDEIAHEIMVYPAIEIDNKRR